MANPFEVLGLPVSADLGDDDIRAAWRRIATATHPDRDDGGDPARYAQAADAYSRLRTPWDRGEARADLTAPHSRPRVRLPRVRLPRTGRPVRGRPGVLVLRLACAAGVVVGAYLAVGCQPATPAIAAGALTWLIRTGRRDLAPKAFSRWPRGGRGR